MYHTFPNGPALHSLKLAGPHRYKHGDSMALNQDLLDILVCPLCRGHLDPVDSEEGLKCAACALVYPVREDIPLMLTEEAIPLPEWERGRRQAVRRPQQASED